MIGIIIAISRILECKTIPQVSGGFTATTSRVQLQIPALSIDDIGVGIAVTRAEVQGSGGIIYSKRFEFSRFVSNKQRNSELFTTIQEDLGTITTTYVTFICGFEFCTLSTKSCF